MYNIYVYIYIYACVCACVCVPSFWFLRSLPLRVIGSAAAAAAAAHPDFGLLLYFFKRA